MSNAPANSAEQRAKALQRNELVTVRYQIANVERATEFYTRHLGFTVEGPRSPAFASLALGNLRLLMSGPGSSGARPMPDGRKQAAGGWNRILIYVEDLEARIKSLKQAGVPFRNAIESGPGGSQIMIEDPDGNPIELHQPPN
jgi:glyoxylase I family protein